jgi:hypothetical protein
MKLTLKETKKAIKNNQTVKFTLESNNARELATNKKYYKRYVKAIVKTVKSFYPALDYSYILSELERYEILLNVSRFDEEGYLIRNGKQRYVTAQTFEVSDNKIYLVNFDYNANYFIVDQELGMKLDSDVAVSDPYRNHFAILTNDPNRLLHVTDKELPLFVKLSMKTNGTFNIVADENIFAGTKSKLGNLDKQKIARKEYEEELNRIRSKVIEVNKVIEPIMGDLIPKLSTKVIKTQKVVSSKIVRDSFHEVSQKFNQSIANKLRLCYDDGYDFITLTSEIRWPQEGEYGGALYREYDGTMCVDQRLADKYIEKNYSKEIKAIKSEIERLNKKLGSKSPIQFEIVCGISVGDKTSNIYAAISLKKLPEEIDSKYFNKMEKLFK